MIGSLSHMIRGIEMNQPYLALFTHQLVDGVRQWQCIACEPTIYVEKPKVRFHILRMNVPVKIKTGFCKRPHHYLGN